MYRSNAVALSRAREREYWTWSVKARRRTTGCMPVRSSSTLMWGPVLCGVFSLIGRELSGGGGGGGSGSGGGGGNGGGRGSGNGSGSGSGSGSGGVRGGGGAWPWPIRPCPAFDTTHLDSI